MRTEILRLFERTWGREPTEAVRVAADGSRREYWRLHGAPPGPVVGAWGPDPAENRAFLSFARTFRAVGIPVPEVYAADEPAGTWLLEDLGDRTLFRALSEARTALGVSVEGGQSAPVPDALLAAYERVVAWLPRIQVEGGRTIDFGAAHPRAAFDGRAMRWDLNYFKYHFLRLADIPFHEGRLEDDFDRLVEHLLASDRSHFLYRDFQSRNILLRDGEPWFIDFQGGRRGALAYDLAALLLDAKAALPVEVRAHLVDRYLEALQGWAPVDAERFREELRGFGLVRIMQAMGAYGYRGFVERKPLFRESIPFAARNLERILTEGLPLPLPELAGVYARIVERWPGPDAADPEATRSEGLTVRIVSFSYRRGYPEDDRGHGGGFVFDCRGLPNPGRSPELAGLTGRDPEVVAALGQAPEAEAFWDRIAPLVEAQVDRYLARGFRDLTVAFGCTGGQHRSVFMAERLARHLGERSPAVGVRLEHREAPHWPEAGWTP